MNIVHLPEEIKQEFLVDLEGKTSASRRGIARLCGVSEGAIRKLLAKVAALDAYLEPPKSLEPIIGQRFEGAHLIGDRQIVCIIEYYAFDAGRYCTLEAKLVFRAFATVGFRTWVQKELGWEPSRHDKEPKLTEIEYIFEGLTKLGIEPKLVEEAKLGALARTFPQLTEAALEAKKLLSSQTKLEELPLSPTELGKAISSQFNLSYVPTARQVNQALVETQLQIIEYRTSSKGKQKAEYRLTEQGKKFGQMQMTSASNSSGMVIIVRWFPLVISQIGYKF